MLEHVPHVVGEALKGVRPGIGKTLLHDPAFSACPTTLEVSSTAFEAGAPLDVRFTADGEGLSPALAWSGSPAGTAATVIVAEDADSPTPAPLVHLIAWLEGGDGAVAEGVWGPAAADDRIGHNSFQKLGWLPPDPPPGHGAHRYVFQVLAVDAWPAFTDRAVGKHDVLEALDGHVLAAGSIVGTYARS